MCVCVYMFMCVYVCVYGHVCVHRCNVSGCVNYVDSCEQSVVLHVIHMHTNTHTCAHRILPLHIHAYVCINTYINTYIYKYIHTTYDRTCYTDASHKVCVCVPVLPLVSSTTVSPGIIFPSSSASRII